MACAAFGEELRRARLEHGLSQNQVAAAVGLSDVHIGRIERGMVPRLSIYHACRLAAVVGLDLSVKAYPGGSPIRDAAHLALLARGRAALPGPGTWHREVPLPLSDDQRAWDALLQSVAGRIAFEAETRLGDLQALQRRVALKRRDDPSIGAVVLLVAASRHNRRILREHGDALAADFPLDSEAIAKALAAGRIPAANGLILI